MKVKLLILLGIMIVPILSSAQTADDSEPVFFNKGKMSVVGEDTAHTVLYVAGDFIVSRDNADAAIKSEIHLNGSKTVITGDFYQEGFYAAGTNENAFVIDPNDNSELTPRFEFRGTTPQVIGTRRYNGMADGVADTVQYTPAWKAANYVDFPIVVVNNDKHVTMMPEIAARVKGLDLYKGRLILDSRRLASTDNLGTGTTVHDESNSSLLAHLYVDENPDMRYGRDNTATLDDYGAVEVRVAMDDPAATVDETKGRSIVGMGTPFQQMKADYFMYNFLMFPYGNNILGYWNFAQTDPETILTPGQGFVVGIDLRGSNYGPYEGFENTDPIYAGKIAFDDRVTDTYKFSRFAFNNRNNIYPLSGQIPSGNVFSGVGVSDNAYAKEELVYDDVTRGLTTGFNYLANPYTTPLDLKELLTPSTKGNNNWNVDINESNGDIMPYVWILNPSSTASGLYDLNGGTGALGDERLSATYTYFLMKDDGGTYGSYDATSGAAVDNISVEDNSTVIAPLQMFLVYGLKSGASITIPENQRVYASGANFLRSASGNTSSAKRDDYLFEVVDLTTKAYDRTAVVLRTPDEVMSAPSAYVDKTVSSVVSGDNSSLKTITTSGKVASTINSVIYTAGPTGDALESKFLALPANEEEVSTPLYLSPSATAQKIVIRAKRLNTMDQINEIWLDDKLKNTSFELSTGNDYETSVTPTDSHDRFTLRFVRSATGISDEPQITDKSITSYYADGVLTVSGFEPSDINSLISIYDIQGRMLKQVKVTDLTMRIAEFFYPGAYIVKVNGNNKSYVSKFLVK